MSNRILIVGSGGREHALAWKLAQSPAVGEIICAPGNGGTAGFCESVPIRADDIDELTTLAQKRRVDLTVVGPDDPLAAGLVDALGRQGLAAFGPTRAAARLESSKALAKKFMLAQGIPTAAGQDFDDYATALAHLRNGPERRLVVKASGLALGKGVFPCQTVSEAEEALKFLMVEGGLGPAGRQVVIEEYLDGPELSFHALADGRMAKLFPPARDHKRAFDGDRGPNTGGMGSFTPVPGVDYGLFCQVADGVIKPAIRGMLDRGTPFAGCLFPGLMLTAAGPKVLEFNARFGDPECQSYLRLLTSDLYPYLHGSAQGCLPAAALAWRTGYAACVVAVADGYPGPYRKGALISGIEEAERLDGVVVFQAGTVRDSFGRPRTCGGRVLGVTALGDTLDEAVDQAYQAMGLISFQGMRYRSDIGRSA